MTTSKQALASLFLALLDFHKARENEGYIYNLPVGLPNLDADKINTYAMRNSASAGVFTAALADLLLVSEHMSDIRPALARSPDIFGTYLEAIRGHSAIEQILELVRKEPRSISELAKQLNFSPEEIVSATASANQLGMVRLERVGDKTTVYPIQTDSR